MAVNQQKCESYSEEWDAPEDGHAKPYREDLGEQPHFVPHAQEISVPVSAVVSFCSPKKRVCVFY